MYKLAKECLAENGVTTLADLLWYDSDIIPNEGEYCAQLRECLSNLEDDAKRYIEIAKSKKKYSNFVEFVKMILAAISTMPTDTKMQFIF